MLRYDVAISAPALGGEPSKNEGVNLAQRLALLIGEDQGKVVGVVHLQSMPIHEQIGAVLGGGFVPGSERRQRSADGFVGHDGIQGRHPRD